MGRPLTSSRAPGLSFLEPALLGRSLTVLRDGKADGKGGGCGGGGGALCPSPALAPLRAELGVLGVDLSAGFADDGRVRCLETGGLGGDSLRVDELSERGESSASSVAPPPRHHGTLPGRMPLVPSCGVFEDSGAAGRSSVRWHAQLCRQAQAPAW
mmetsp:Transcript_82938/g.146543  ORF Transcript_82938/g.146543 Transcript_82938/m.146543 type:complete len:156 (-) Transcript_82938:831-1298(-)